MSDLDSPLVMDSDDALNSSSSDDSVSATVSGSSLNSNSTMHPRLLSFGPLPSWRSLPPLSRPVPSMHSASFVSSTEHSLSSANRWSQRRSLDVPPPAMTSSTFIPSILSVESGSTSPGSFSQTISFPRNGEHRISNVTESSPIPSSSPSRLFTSSPTKSLLSQDSGTLPQSNSHTPASSPRKKPSPRAGLSASSTTFAPSGSSAELLRPAQETVLFEPSAASTSGVFPQAPVASVAATSSLLGLLRHAQVFPDDLPPSSPPPIIYSPLQSLPTSQDSRDSNSRDVTGVDLEDSPIVLGHCDAILPRASTLLATLPNSTITSPPRQTISDSRPTDGACSESDIASSVGEETVTSARPEDHHAGVSSHAMLVSQDTDVQDRSSLKRKASPEMPLPHDMEPAPAVTAIDETTGREEDMEVAPSLINDVQDDPASDPSLCASSSKKRKLDISTPSPRRVTPAAQRLQNKKLAAPFRSPLRQQASSGASRSDRSAERTSSPSIKATTTRPYDSSPLRPSSTSLVSSVTSATPSRPIAFPAKKPDASRVTSQFKSPFKRSASGSSMAPAPALSSTRLTPAVQALEARVQLLKRAVKIKDGELNGTQKPLDDLVLKWRTAGRDIARDVWAVVKDEPKQEAKGWPAERGGFNSSWGYDKDDGGGTDAQGDKEREAFEEEEKAKDKVEDTIGTMLRQLRIDPATLGWDDDEGDFVDT